MMDGKNNQIGKAEASSENMESAMQGLSTVPTTVTLSAEQFERLYLTPRTHRQTALTKKTGKSDTFVGLPLIFLSSTAGVMSNGVDKPPEH